MRSVRDSSANSMAWKKNRASVNQSGRYGDDLQSIRRELAKNRRRIVGGGGGTQVEHFKGEYDVAAESGFYVTYDQVVIASGANSGFYYFVGTNYVKNDFPWLGGGNWIKIPNANALGQWQ